jgi:hypothetical protein
MGAAGKPGWAMAWRLGPAAVAACARAHSRPQRGHRVRGGAVAGLPSARRRQGPPREHQRGSGVTPGKSGGGGAYPSGGTAGRRRKSFGAAAFVGGEGAPVVADGGDEVLQLG